MSILLVFLKVFSDNFNINTIPMRKKETSQVLSNSLLVAKVIQGIPIIGALGGVVNPVIISRVGKYANL
ncbi:MAG: EcsC family protein [Lachnotalea sp.]